MNARTLIVDAFSAALDAVRPDTAVARFLHRSESSEVLIDGRSIGSTDEIQVIAIGKAAVPMMAGALQALGDAVARGFVITKDGHVDRALPDRVEVHEAAHPVLDDRSVSATLRLLDWVAGIPGDATVLCLISGGGSALLEAPVDEISLADLQRATHLLLQGGADIYQLNAVRSHLSRVKGGGLRAAIPAKRVVTLLLSDVIGNDPAVIASGPTVALRTTREDAREAISDLGLSNRVPAGVTRLLARDSDAKAGTYPGDIVAVVADNPRAVDAAAADLRERGLRVQVEDEPRTGEARIAAREWVMRLRDVTGDVDAVVGGGELTVTVEGNGAGGRNTEFALAAAMELERLKIDEWTVASLATDGQDGPTDVAGAIVDGAIPARLRERHIDPITALHENDSFPGLEAAGAVLRTGPTGTNVNDLYFAVRTRQS